MAEVISTIKAAGGDYSSLQAWEDDADDSANAEQTAECYDNGSGTFDMGEVALTNWASTPTLAIHPKIIAADGEQHDGTDAANGCHISVSAGNVGIAVNNGLSYTEVRGIRIDLDGKSVGVNIAFGSGNAMDGVIIDSCLIRVNTTNGITDDSSVINIASNTTDAGQTDTIKIINNVIYGNGEGDIGDADVHGIRLIAIRNAGGSNTIDLLIANNSVHQIGLVADNSGFGIEVDDFIIAGTVVINLEVKNNVVTESDNIDFSDATGGSTTVNFTASNNCSSDTSGDDWGASGALISQVPVDLYVSDNDLTPKAGSNLLDAGATVSEVAVDVLGVSRPQGSDYDIGAFEIPVAPPTADDLIGLIGMKILPS